MGGVLPASVKRLLSSAPWNQDGLSESLETEAGIGAGQYLERWGKRFRGASESRVIYGLEIPGGY